MVEGEERGWGMKREKSGRKKITIVGREKRTLV